MRRIGLVDIFTLGNLSGCGNETWEFDESGLVRIRFARINDLPIKEADLKYDWPLGRRPDSHPALSELGL